MKRSKYGINVLREMRDEMLRFQDEDSKFYANSKDPWLPIMESILQRLEDSGSLRKIAYRVIREHELETFMNSCATKSIKELKEGK